MIIQSTIRKPKSVQPTESVVILDEAQEQAVWVPKSEFETLMDDPAVQMVQQQVLGAAAAALGDQAGLPVKLVATGIKHQGLFERAMSRDFKTGDMARLTGVACSAGSAFSAALGYPVAKDVLKLSSKVMFAVADLREDYVVMTADSDPQSTGFFERTAEAVDAGQGGA